MKKIKLSKKLIVIIIIVAIVLAFVVYSFFKNNGEEFVLEKVIRGTVVKEVSETGTVKASEKAGLSFKYSGRIQRLYVDVGDVVRTGQVLVKLGSSDLAIQLDESEAALAVVKAKKANAQVSLENARQNLKDVEADAKEDLNNAYEDALTDLDDAYLEIYNTFNVVDSIKRDYFTSSDQEGSNVTSKTNVIENAVNKVKPYIDSAKSGSNDDIDTALSQTKSYLSNTKEALEVIRDMTETISYRNTVSSADKTSLDNQKSYINTDYTNIVNAKQTVSTTKVTNDFNINTAKAEIASLESQLEEGGLYDAQINQAEADISFLENKIYEASLRSPANGQITDIEKRTGETIQASETVISFLPIAPFKVEVDIYEEDIVDVKVGDPVRINLVAFSDETLRGRVVSVDPAEKLIDGVVYYEVNIDFEEVKEGTKIGMTVDIVIETDRRENVLIISEDLIDEVNGKVMVEVSKDGEIEEREIRIGLEGEDYVEIISGLEEGEEVVVK